MNNSTHTYRWNPPAGVERKKNTIYLLHGTGEHANRYTELVSRLTESGWIVGAHDHPGHGRSDGKRGLIDPPGALATQAAIQIQSFAKETHSKPFVFGHSLGGVLITELVLTHGIDVSGLVLSAPAYVPHMGLMDHVKLNVLSLLAPKLCLDLGYDASRLTHDVDIRTAAHSDPLIHSFKSATLINWLLQSGKSSLSKAENLSLPTLLLLAGDDLVADSSKSRLFADSVPSQHITTIEYENAYHELLNETIELRERVLDDIIKWLQKFE